MSVPVEATTSGDGVRLPFPPVARARRRRRPSGEPPPLPRQLNRSGKFWLAVAGLAILFCVLLVPAGGLTLRLDEIEKPVLTGLSGLRTGVATGFFRGVDAAIGPVVLGGWWASLLVMLFWRRWRHLFVWIATMWLVSNLSSTANEVIQRPRPLTVEILGAWQGFAMPSRPVAVLTATAVNVLYALLPAGRIRGRGKLVAAGLVALVCAGRLYLAVDHPTDQLVAVALGVAVPLAGWRLLVPNDVFPVTYRRGRAAHLDVTGHRGEAIVRALHDQLGVVVTAVTPFGLEGSGGSTPLRLTVKGEEPTYLFAKLYAITHLRSDRWYKLGRTLLYGRLEDEKPFNTVRRLVQYEDYVLRLMHSAGLPVPEPYGIVEITPEREYLLVAEFFHGAKEAGDVDMDESLIDQGLAIVRQLWDAGLAHRDIKPANLLVRDGRMLMIDSAFAEVRPSPWRQAVDLGNMMLVLALRSDVPTVYARARRQFSDGEIAEAFAATRGLTMPSQLRRMIRDHGRDLHAEFTRLLPEQHPPIRIQRWTVRRVGLLIGMLLLALLASQLVIELLRSPL
ncbi:MAG TPA: RIO1 family regulatory kinase/ATPase [Mycobacteriales bacterium]|nr:RIO1 family regulatory kinase/ATPase [Mycobacteriales bacterium]